MRFVLAALSVVGCGSTKSQVVVEPTELGESRASPWSTVVVGSRLEIGSDVTGGCHGGGKSFGAIFSSKDVPSDGKSCEVPGYRVEVACSAPCDVDGTEGTHHGRARIGIRPRQVGRLEIRISTVVEETGKRTEHRLAAVDVVPIDGASIELWCGFDRNALDELVPCPSTIPFESPRIQPRLVVRGTSADTSEMTVNDVPVRALWIDRWPRHYIPLGAVFPGHVSTTGMIRGRYQVRLRVETLARDFDLELK